MTVAFSDTNLLCDMLRPLPNLSNKAATAGGWPQEAVGMWGACVLDRPVERKVRQSLSPLSKAVWRAAAALLTSCTIFRSAPPADATSAFYVRRKPLSATINTLANALYKVPGCTGVR